MFAEVRFPDSISFGSSGGPEFSTAIVAMKNGKEQRNINWKDCRLKYNVINGIKTTEQIDELITFFRARKGRAIGFRFKDWSDYKAVNEIIGYGDSSKREFQLVKKYSNEQFSYERILKKIVKDTVKVEIDGVLTNDYSVNYNTGIITFNKAPLTESQIKASFEFDVPVRFDLDYFEISMDSINVGKIKDITLIEIID